MCVSEKKISVIIPVYNPGKYLYRCLDSILCQTYRNLEVILVDDGSTDDSLRVCRNYEKKDARVKAFTQKNAGVSAARNKGIEASTGDYLSFIDSDDYVEPDLYETLIEAFDREKADIVCYEYFVTYADHEDLHSFKDKSWYGMKDRKTAMEHQVNGVPFLWTKMFRKDLVSDLRFTVGLARGEDGEYCRYAIHRAEKVFYIDKPMIHYVQSEESACRGVFRPSQLSAMNTADKTRAFFKENYPELYGVKCINYLHLLVMLYCDMHADKEPWKEEKKKVYKEFCKVKKLVQRSDFSRKERIKFSSFRAAPHLFAAVHTARTK